MRLGKDSIIDLPRMGRNPLLRHVSWLETWVFSAVNRTGYDSQPDHEVMIRPGEVMREQIPQTEVGDNPWHRSGAFVS